MSSYTNEYQRNEAKVLGAVICLSGGFDPLHFGHTRLIQGAVNFGKVVIILNSDEWVIRRKGFFLMPWIERREILLALRGVDEVVGVDDSDDTVCEALKRIKPTVFGNGGLRTQVNTPERELCMDTDIRLVYGIGGGAGDSVTFDLREKIREVE